MNVHHVLFFCFLSALCERDAGLVRANTRLIRPEGSSVTVACHFTLSRGRKKFLCKDECKEEDVLVETEAEWARSGRFSIRYEGGTFPLTSTVVYVSISQLTGSDSGRYRCGLERPFLPDSYRTFEIRVTEALQTVPEALKQQTEAAAAVHSAKVSRPGYVLPLVVCVSVVVLFAVVVLLLFKLKTSLNSRGRSDDRNMQLTIKVSPISTCEESSNDREQFYCNL